jgi:CheY-like chemotaxis protein
VKILLVEDNPLSRTLARDILVHAGHEIVEATSVPEGQERLRADQPFDVVLMDIGIPGGGGELLLGQIRADPSLARLPVVAMTALAMRGDRERLLAAGFDGYISKPIDTRNLAATVVELVNQAKAR